MKTFAEISKGIKPVQNPSGKIVLAMTKGEVHDIGKTVIKGLFLYNNIEVIDLGVVSSPEPVLKAIEKHQPDAVGLSAMLNSSISQMRDVASALSQIQCRIPLLIGGAATTLAHTAAFIAPEYTTGQTIHVHDVHYCQELIERLFQDGSVEDRNEQARADFQTTQKNKTILSIEEARAKGLKMNWKEKDIVKPSFLGVKVFDDYNLNDVLGCADWTTLFMAYGMKGKFPSLLKDKEIGEAARQLHQDAEEFLKKVIDDKLLQAKAVIGFFPANSVGDDIEIFVDGKTFTYHTLRQQAAHAEGKPYYALSDFIAPKDTGLQDYVGLFAVTAGIGLDELVQAYEAEGDYYHSIMAKSVADILAESFAERMHQRVRKEFWGYAPDENLTMEEIFQCRFQGIRPAPGYPACPDHGEKPLLFEILEATKHTGVSLSETFAMHPASSICGVYFAHPESKYYWIGALGDDQLAEYAQRTGSTLKNIKKQLIFHVTDV